MPIRTLIVDDVPTSAAVLKTLYRLYEDVEVIGVVGSKQEAIEFIENNEIDLASVDISLPDGDGFEVCAEIRKKFPRAFIVICTMDENAENEALANQNRADYFAGKPLSTAQVDDLLGIYRRRKESLEAQTSSSQNAKEWQWMDSVLHKTST